MGADNQPKHRQARRLDRKQSIRKSYDRILIVTEGEKTEPNYFHEIRVKYRLSTANVDVEPSGFGTQPKQIAEYAEHVFLYGDSHKKIKEKAFEKVYIVFDRDEHTTYYDALSYIEGLDRSKIKNDLGNPVNFYAIASIPCFEFWLLLHYENITHWMHRDDVYHRLKSHISDYEKAATGIFSKTSEYLIDAKQRAKSLINYKEGDDKDKDINNTHGSNRYNENEPYTHVWALIEELEALKR